MKLRQEDVIELLSTSAKVCSILTGPKDSWTCVELSGGRLNMVYLVEDKSTGNKLVAKQGLPYVRVMGEGYPLPATRTYYEFLAYQEYKRVNKEAVPEPLEYFEGAFLMVSTYLKDYDLLSRALAGGNGAGDFGRELGGLLADLAIRTSDIGAGVEDKRRMNHVFSGNTAQSRITDNTIFTEPFIDHPDNRWSQPELDEEVQAVRTDMALRKSVETMKYAFATKFQTLMHGNLSLSNIMVKNDEVRIIDAEYAAVGPFSFDVAFVFASLVVFLHTSSIQSQHDLNSYIHKQIDDFWSSYKERFQEVWVSLEDSSLCLPSATIQDSTLQLIMNEVLSDILHEAVAMAGIVLVRRVIGVAHAPEVDAITDRPTRVTVEKSILKHALQMAKCSRVDPAAMMDALHCK